MNQYKPHIWWHESIKLWVCGYRNIEGWFGSTPVEAYQRWRMVKYG